MKDANILDTIKVSAAGNMKQLKTKLHQSPCNTYKNDINEIESGNKY